MGWFSKRKPEPNETPSQAVSLDVDQETGGENAELPPGEFETLEAALVAFYEKHNPSMVARFIPWYD